MVPISLIGNGFQECCRCCRSVADLLPIKLLMDNDVADVADFPTRNAIQCQGPKRVSLGAEVIEIPEKKLDVKALILELLATP